MSKSYNGRQKKIIAWLKMFISKAKAVRRRLLSSVSYISESHIRIFIIVTHFNIKIVNRYCLLSDANNYMVFIGSLEALNTAARSEKFVILPFEKEIFAK